MAAKASRKVQILGLSEDNNFISSYILLTTLIFLSDEWGVR